MLRQWNIQLPSFPYYLTHWGRDKMNAISQKTFSNAFSWMKMFEFWLDLKFVPKGPINNTPALVQKMAWRHSGDKPLSEPMMVCLPTHICITQPQWVKTPTMHRSLSPSKTKNNTYKYIPKICKNILSNNSIFISTLFVITFSEKAHACSYFIHIMFFINVEQIPHVEYKHFSLSNVGFTANDFGQHWT